jgi:hypothetical protein
MAGNLTPQPGKLQAFPMEIVREFNNLPGGAIGRQGRPQDRGTGCKTSLLQVRIVDGINDCPVSH